MVITHSTARRRMQATPNTPARITGTTAPRRHTAPTMGRPWPTPIRHRPNTVGGSCCDGTTCQCGCVLPPVVPFIGLALAPHALIDAAFVSLEQHAVVRRGSPPFRPPGGLISSLAEACCPSGTVRTRCIGHAVR
jgi:hypothetical protein